MNPLKPLGFARRTLAGALVFVFLTASGLAFSQPANRDAGTHPADVITSWLNLQLRIVRTTPAPPPFTVRRFGYTAVALYEALAPGMAGYQSIAPQLNGLAGLPAVTPGARYHWPACANAALAAMNRYLYPMTSPANKAAVDSLEAANTAQYAGNRPADELSRSVDFGRKIAAAVFGWAEADGSNNNETYALPVGEGLYELTPPRFVPAALPYWGKCRPMLMGSLEGADRDAPIPFSKDPSSAYFAQAKEVFDLSQHLTPDQKAIALFWADDPDGKSFGGGHWMAILNQILTARKPALDAAAIAFARLGIATAEAGVCIFKGKYKYNGMRPVTYIRTVMKQPDWSPLIVTPPHPEYPSGHALISGSAAQTLALLFGENYAFTDTSYNWLGLGPRSYRSFQEAAQEAGDSRVYGGIHYRHSCDVSLKSGKIIARNVAEKLKFRP
ncbi:vanadium-dependent haloperoxidase [Larkinella soli]|uniref:vanadium-dependent haloperoxidase n=1 Tax=Larkinella soli TaxID=1770527 RepID=UPI000FFC6F78|nr:vanadium-dependent haloperoxidase [Larkinella soli]